MTDLPTGWVGPQRGTRAHLTLVHDPDIGLLRSILGHADGHEQRAVREALAVLDGATIDQLVRAREEE